MRGMYHENVYVITQGLSLPSYFHKITHINICISFDIGSDNSEMYSEKQELKLFKRRVDLSLSSYWKSEY